MNKAQRDRFLKLRSISDSYSFQVNINNLNDDLIDAYNATWCYNDAFGVIDNKGLKVSPLILIPHHPNPGDRST